MSKLSVAIYGASGYTGFELVKILLRHPFVQIVALTANANAGQLLSDLDPSLPAIPLVTAEQVDTRQLDVAFLCLPHAASASAAQGLLNAGVTVIDLSADFRLKDLATYEKWYKVTHPCPELLESAVYGLTEFARSELRGAKLVANPGCYVTSVLLGTAPVLQKGWVAGNIIADSASGVSGAGRAPKQNTHFVEVAENYSAYSIGQAHRHLPEMLQQMRLWSPSGQAELVFSPHLLPISRGILSTIYIPLAGSPTLADIHLLYEETYRGEPFVQVLPLGQTASIQHTVRTNRCAIGLTLVGSLLIVTSSLDNLVKGASGQAVQNLNAVFGLPETTGLLA
jgi:N-acetyl-gamma-glutamyl-phosphate reductase